MRDPLIRTVKTLKTNGEGYIVKPQTLYKPASDWFFNETKKATNKLSSGTLTHIQNKLISQVDYLLTVVAGIPMMRDLIKQSTVA
jgi:hypothetical protein